MLKSALCAVPYVPPPSPRQSPWIPLLLFYFLCIAFVSFIHLSPVSYRICTNIPSRAQYLIIPSYLPTYSPPHLLHYPPASLVRRALAVKLLSSFYTYLLHHRTLHSLPDIFVTSCLVCPYPSWIPARYALCPRPAMTFSLATACNCTSTNYASISGPYARTKSHLTIP